MKIKEGFVKKPIMDEIVVVPTGEASKSFEGLIKLNETASFIWDEIEQGKNIDEIVDDISSIYEVNKNDAKKDVEKIIDQIRDSGFLEEE